MSSELIRSSPVPSRRQGRRSPDVRRARPTFVPGFAPSSGSAVAALAAVFARKIVVVGSDGCLFSTPSCP